MEPTGTTVKNSTVDLSLKELFKKSKDIMLILLKLTKRESTNSLLLLKKNLLPSILLVSSSLKELYPWLENSVNPYPMTLTGLLRVEFLQLRTKEVVDPAGLSLLQELWNQLLKSEDKLLVSLNNNWLTAADPKETKDAMEDGHHLL